MALEYKIHFNGEWVGVKKSYVIIVILILFFTRIFITY